MLVSRKESRSPFLTGQLLGWGFESITEVTFSPEGRALMCGSVTVTVLLFDIEVLFHLKDRRLHSLSSTFLKKKGCVKLH